MLSLTTAAGRPAAPNRMGVECSQDAAILIMASAGAYEAGNGVAMGPSTHFYRPISDKTNENNACQKPGKVIMRILLSHESPPVEGSISGMSLGMPASRRHRAKRKRVPSRDREPKKVAGRRLPSERSLCHPGMIFADKQDENCCPECLNRECHPAWIRLPTRAGALRHDHDCPA